MDVLLSREPLDLWTIAYHNAPNNPIETRKLSHPPCSCRVHLTETGERQGLAWPGCREALFSGSSCGPGAMHCRPARMIAGSEAAHVGRRGWREALNVGLKTR